MPKSSPAPKDPQPKPSAPAAPCDVTVTVFGGARNPTPCGVAEHSWADFVSDLPEILAVEGASKEALTGLVFAHVRGRRCNANTGDHTALAIDVDHPTPKLRKHLERFRCVAYESPSSGMPGKGERLRVIMSLTSPVPAHAVPEARSALARELGLDPKASGVDGARSISQLMFAGRVRGTPERKHWAYDGSPWTPPPPGEAPTQDNPSTYGEHRYPERGADDIPDLAPLRTAIEPEAGGRRNGGRLHMRAVGGYLAREGYHPDAIYTAVHALPSSQPDVRAQQALEAAEQHYAGHPHTAGFKALKEHFGENVAAALESAVRRVVPEWVVSIASAAQTRVREGGKLRPVDRLMIAWAGLEVPNDAEATCGTDGAYWTFDFTRDTNPPEMLCARLGLVKEGGRVNVLVGEPGKGKTWSAMALALAVAAGKPVFGAFECKRGVVRHIDSDMGARTTMRRYAKLARGMGVDLGKVTREQRLAVRGGVCLTSGGKPDPAAYAELETALAGVDLLIIDSLISVAPGIDENSSAFAEVVKKLMRVSDATGTVVLMLHHPGKGEASKRGRGTSALDADWGAWWVLDAGGHWKQHKKHGDVDELAAPFTTAFDSTETAGARLAGSDSGAVTIRVVDSHDNAEDERKRVARALSEYGTEGCSQRDVEEKLAGELSRQGTRQAIASMLQEQLCYRADGKSGKRSGTIVLTDEGANWAGLGKRLSAVRSAR